MLIDIFIFAAVFVLGYATCFYYLVRKTIGTILIVDQDGETGLLLEIKNGCTDQIKPGNIVKLAVNTYSITQDK